MDNESLIVREEMNFLRKLVIVGKKIHSLTHRELDSCKDYYKGKSVKISYKDKMFDDVIVYDNNIDREYKELVFELLELSLFNYEKFHLNKKSTLHAFGKKFTWIFNRENLPHILGIDKLMVNKKNNVPDVVNLINEIIKENNGDDFINKGPVDRLKEIDKYKNQIMDFEEKNKINLFNYERIRVKTASYVNIHEFDDKKIAFEVQTFPNNKGKDRYRISLMKSLNDNDKNNTSTIVFENDYMIDDEIVMAPYSSRIETKKLEKAIDGYRISKFQPNNKARTTIVDNNVTIMEYNIKEKKRTNELSWNKRK